MTFLLPRFQLGVEYNNYPEFIAYRKKQKLQKQDAWTAIAALFSAAMGGFFDGLYFYMGAVTLAVFSPQVYMILLGVSVALLVTCMIVRVHEENMFQRRYLLTCIQPKLELSREASKILMSQLDALLDNSPAAATGEDLKTLISFLETSVQKRNKTFFEKRPIDVNLIDEPREVAIQLLLAELSHEIKKTIKLKRKQKKGVRSSFGNAFMAGLFNGLALQGVIASLMFVIVTLFYGTLACPPMFIMSCLALGIMAIIACCVQALLQYRTFRAAFDKEDQQFSQEYSSVAELQEVFKQGRKGLSDAKLHTLLLETLDYIDSTPVDHSLDYMVVEWCEVWRLFLTGLSKGDKASFELFYNLLKQYDELWFMPVVLFSSAICFAIAFALHYLTKTFAPTPPNYVDVVAQDKQIPICRYDDEHSVVKESTARPSALVANSFQSHRANRGLRRYGSDKCLQREGVTDSPFTSNGYILS